jgi:Fur family ferric uptake transcriptional regulator
MSNRRETISHLLADRGHRLTGPRLSVVQVLAESEMPLSVAEIHARLGTRRVNLVSVYRTVNLLMKMGVLRAPDRSRKGQRYELAEQFTGHHHHLICQRCEGIEDLEGCPLGDDVLTRLSARLRRLRSFRVMEHELRVFGLCRSCAG